MSSQTLAALGLLAVVTGCSDVREATSEGSGNASAGETTGTGSGDDDDDDDDEGVLDVAVDDTQGNGGDSDNMSGCDKVDFLFVVDNSGSMADEQQTLIDAFSPFIAAIEERVGDSNDFHVMVVDVDAWVFGECPEACSEAAVCDQASSCGVTEECGFPCALRDLCETGDFVCEQTEPFECEDVMGAGITYPRGRASSSTDCGFATGARWMDANEPDLPGAFGCAARVGTGSSADTEQPMDAMVAALANEGPAAICNEGFLRDDAILVVTFITDENDDPTDSTGSPTGWHDALVAAKQGDEQAVVVLGLFGDNDQPDGICDPLSHDFATGAEPAPRLREFVGLWGERGHIGSICAGDYLPFFTSAVDSIGTACDEFVPPG
jgi:hypothetical protein